MGHMYFISSKVADDATALGLASTRPSSRAAIQRSVILGKEVKHPFGNVLYGDWVFTVVVADNQSRVEAVHFIQCLFCKDTQKQLVYNECNHCTGQGCVPCNGTGLIQAEIPCVLCTPSPPLLCLGKGGYKGKNPRKKETN